MCIHHLNEMVFVVKWHVGDRTDVLLMSGEDLDKGGREKSTAAIAVSKPPHTCSSFNKKMSHHG